MMQRKLHLLFLVVFSWIGNVGYTQIGGWSDADFGVTVAKSVFKAKRVIPPSPEAAELGKYGNTPVNLFTGTPRISLPLVELKGQRLSLPISLSYNASGFKPDEVATWIGQGWSLNAGGVVTKSVVGNPDQQDNYFSANHNLPPSTDLIATYNYIDQLRNGLIESQPDLYFYNFPGGSGKFIVKPDHSILLKEYAGLRITEPGETIVTIVDENGIQYNFTATEHTDVILDDGDTENPGSRAYGYTSSWYLTSMVSADGNEQIIFTYYTCAQKHYPVRNPLPNESYSYSRQQGGPLLGTGHTSSMPPQTEISGKKYLQEIQFIKNGRTTDYVVFESVANSRTDLAGGAFPDERKLIAIKHFTRDALNMNWQLLKHYSLVTDYFTSHLGSRLRLKELHEIPSGSSTPNKPPYKFDYYSAVNLPGYGGSGIDHWGFYNGGSAASIMPNYNLSTLLITAENRAPVLEGSLAGALIQITYPTGGFTQFGYELHSAKGPESNSAEFPVGGLRIKTIKDFAGPNSLATAKLYEYKLEDGTSSGLAKVPEYMSVSTNTNYYAPQFNGSGETIQSTNYSISATAIGGLGSIQGSHIGYKRVTERQINLANGESLGQMIYHYYTQCWWK